MKYISGESRPSGSRHRSRRMETKPDRNAHSDSTGCHRPTRRALVGLPPVSGLIR
jgi:hypothetical protein